MVQRQDSAKVEQRVGIGNRAAPHSIGVVLTITAASSRVRGEHRARQL